MTIYNNVPKTTPTSSSDQTIRAFNQYFAQPLELNHSDVMAMTGFFEKRGFGRDSAEGTALVILQQSVKDGINPMAIMDTLRGLDDVQLSTLVGEILNYNRFKTSVLGTYTAPQQPDIIARNIMA